jgi:glyoxylase I family protein
VKTVIKIEGIHHVSLVVTDLERAITFYRDQLGLKEIKRPPFDFPGAWFAIGENQQLHLIVHPTSQTLRKDGGIDSRDGHFAIRVKDYEATLNHLKGQGIEVKEKPNSRSGFKQIFCTDPDGNIIEFHVPRN